MCTAILFQPSMSYFGRNLDLEYSYNETVTITPRGYPFSFRFAGQTTTNFAIIGMATVSENYPLYYDATNEYGLSMAGLNFPGNAKYLPYRNNSVNIAPFEFIPWILRQCKDITEARCLLEKVNLIDTPFNNRFPPTPLHWLLSDKTSALTIEPTESGLHIYENPIGVLTNNPPFPYHLYNLANYLNLTREEPINRFSSNINLEPHSRGMGGFGLPGDLSSQSRFIRAAFTKLNSVCDADEQSAVSQFFHILDSVAQTKGCVKVNGKYEITAYSSCCNLDTCVYYYTTYKNRQITALNLFAENLSCHQLISYPLNVHQQIKYENSKRPRT